MAETIDLTPSPRVLRMLGEIDFKAWQCLCEIIDNSIDSYSSESFKELKVTPKIKVKLPTNTATTLKESDMLEIEDNAEGMTIEELNKNLKAGYSSNGPSDKMGLFGMGFNIATARLGTKTIIITTTKSSSEFIKVTIDFQEMEKLGHFLAPVERIAKKADQMNDHGTIVGITQLRTEHVKPLYRRKKQVEVLGKIYGRLLSEKDIKIEYSGHNCKPIKHCTWSEYRNGQNKNGSVPAKINIDESLGEMKFCSTCWIWIDNSELICPSCEDHSSVKKRERRIKGWVGIQRYFDKKHFGIDFIRNGRVIEELDKSFFDWLDPNTEEEELEYPVDGHGGLGRIVGELEIDFVKVTHQKDAFDKNTQDWRDVRLFIRGDSPIRPNIAKNLGYPPNTSPIARLFSAFRKTTGSVANLVPVKSNGSAMIKDPYIDELKKKFFDGLSDYIEDKKWWELVNQTIKDEDEEDEDDPFDDENEGGGKGENEGGGKGENEGEDEGENEGEDDSFKTKPDTFLSQKYRLDLFKNIDIRVIAEEAQEGHHADGFQVELKGNELIFIYWPKSPIFRENLIQPADFLINELSYHFHIISQNEVSKVPISVVEMKLRDKYFSDLHPTLSELRRQVEIFQEDLIDHFKSKTPKFKINISVISKNDLDAIRKKLAQNEFLDSAKIEEALEKGEFMSYASFNALKSLMIEHPQLVFDGVFFSKKWTSNKLNSEMLQDKEEMQSFLNDIEWFNENSSAVGRLWMGRITRLAGSLSILTNWRA
ncbi:ATP-binding protein [Candidatus Thioglobus sp.]|nr:ATP-binding protein [Candidatus Thioglobus sp.]